MQIEIFFYPCDFLNVKTSLHMLCKILRFFSIELLKIHLMDSNGPNFEIKKGTKSLHPNIHKHFVLCTVVGTKLILQLPISQVQKLQPSVSSQRAAHFCQVSLFQKVILKFTALKMDTKGSTLLPGLPYNKQLF